MLQKREASTTTKGKKVHDFSWYIRQYRKDIPTRPHTYHPILSFSVCNLWNRETCLTENAFAKKPLTLISSSVLLFGVILSSLLFIFRQKRMINVISIFLWQIHQFGVHCKMVQVVLPVRAYEIAAKSLPFALFPSFSLSVAPFLLSCNEV